MSRRTMRMATLALACVLAGRLTVAEAGAGKKQCPTTELTRVSYPVADLVVPIPGGDPLPVVSCQTLENRLMELIRAVVAPASCARRAVRRRYSIIR